MMPTTLVLGVSGYTGMHLARELVDRGHDVIGVSRSAPEPSLDGVELVAGSLLDLDLVLPLVDRADSVVSAVRAAAVADQGRSFSASLQALLPAVVARRARLGVVGGAGSLRFPGSDRLRMDDPELPAAQRPEAREQFAALTMLRETDADLDWFYVSPPKLFGSYAPGVRTGRYRTGIDELVVAADGSSTISGQDFAIAFVDELELRRHPRRRFSVGY
jgi:uncharacterized protein